MKADKTTLLGYALWPAMALLLLVVAGCSGGKSGLQPIPDESLPRTEQPISRQGYNHFVNASLLELFGLADDALSEYKKALNYFPESSEIRTDYARLLFREQRIDEALEQALAIPDKSSEVYLLIGDCYRFAEKTEPAMENYRKAIALDPENINAYWYLAGYYRQLGQMNEAIDAYYHLAQLSETFRIWQELGTMLGREGRYSEALKAFNESIALNPEKANINSFLGLAATYDALDSIPQAEAAFQNATELDPYDVRIYRQKLDMYQARQDIDNSIKTARELVALVPSDWLAQRRLGVLLYVDNQLEAADSLFASRIDFGDEHVLNYFYRGRIALETKRLDDAKDLFNTALQKDSLFIEGYLNLGFIYRELDSLDTAIKVLKLGLDNCSEDEDRIRVLFSLGSVEERNGQFHDAVTTFQGLIALDSQHAPALNYLGYMLADRGEQLTYALELIERALAISPDNGAYLDSYAWVHYKMGNYNVALDELKKAIALIHSDPVVFEHMGDVYKALGDETTAEQYYQRARETESAGPDSEEIKQ